jgi:hypothetical protein
MELDCRGDGSKRKMAGWEEFISSEGVKIASPEKMNTDGLRVLLRWKPPREKDPSTMNRILAHIYAGLAFTARDLDENRFYGLSRIARRAAKMSTT